MQRRINKNSVISFMVRARYRNVKESHVANKKKENNSLQKPDFLYPVKI